MMIEVFDTAAARIALARRMLACPDCGQPLRPWGRARERTVRGPGGALMTVRPDRVVCTGCGATHVVPGAGLLPGRAYAAGLIGQALVAAALGRGHRRIAGGLAVPAGTVRGWARAARRCVGQLRAAGVRAVVALDPNALPTRVCPDEAGCALDALGAVAARAWPSARAAARQPVGRINVLTRGRLLAMARPAEPPAPFPAPACPLTGITAQNPPSVRHLAHAARHGAHETA